MTEKSRSGSTSKAKSPRTERTRRRIREAANLLFLERGFRNTTVDAIVEVVGISKGTFYLHFQRKEDLLLEYGSVRLLQIREALPGLLCGKRFEQALNEIIDLVVRDKTWGRELTGLAISEMGANADRLPISAPYRILEPLVELAQARGEVRVDIPAEALSQFVLRSILGALREWGLGTSDLNRDEAVDYVLSLVFDALKRREGQTQK